VQIRVVAERRVRAPMSGDRFSPFLRLPTRTQVFNVTPGPDLQSGAIFRRSFPHQAVKDRRRIVEAYYPVHLKQRSGMLHCCPTARVH